VCISTLVDFELLLELKIEQKQGTSLVKLVLSRKKSGLRTEQLSVPVILGEYCVRIHSEPAISRCLGSFDRSLYSIDFSVSSSITAHARYLYSCWSGMNASACPPLYSSSIATAFPYPLEDFNRIGILSSVLQYCACTLSNMVADSACFHAVWFGLVSLVAD
jgi:hypothetical protein